MKGMLNNMKTVDINCDMGESFGIYKLGMDEEIIKLISSANIACGFHAGDPNVMDYTVKMAKKNNVGIGVHMGFPDLMGFGRRAMDISYEHLVNYNIYQMGALEAFCRKHGVKIQHIKAHGGMGTLSDIDKKVADAISESTLIFAPEAKVFARPGTEMYKSALENGLSVVHEVYADRAYTNKGTLVSRDIPGSVITNPDEAAEHILRMILKGKVKTFEGEFIDIKAESVCVHGDTENALQIVHALITKLEEAEIKISPVGNWHRD